jgi:hypothetical protein
MNEAPIRTSSAQSPMVEGERRGLVGFADFDLHEREVGAVARRYRLPRQEPARGADTSRRVSRRLDRASSPADDSFRAFECPGVRALARDAEPFGNFGCRA